MTGTILFVAALLLLISVLASKISDRFGVPALLLFLALGMLAGSEGPGGVYFDDPAAAQFIGVVALVLILFAGGLDTDWRQVRPVLKEGVLLSLAGVLLTALIVGLFTHLLLNFPLTEGLLLGAIVSSTDAAAVFSVLRSQGIALKGRLTSLLELESGSNDPMAIFLTIGLTRMMAQPGFSAWELLFLFVRQIALGAALGYVMGRLMLALVNRIKLGYEGLYPVLTLALVFLTFGVTDVLGGSGFLAVYLAGLYLGRHDFIHRRSLRRFHDGLAWLMQIAMFLALGLLVFPSRLTTVLEAGLLIVACLMFLARPASVFLSLLPSSLGWREKLLVSWVGLRGAAPIILATFPLLAGIPQAEFMFNVVFFVVLTSVLLQGTSIPLAARWLRVDVPSVPVRPYPLEYTPVAGWKGEVRELHLPPGCPMAGRAIVELGLPAEFLIVLIARGEEFLISHGGTVLQAGDKLLVLSDREALRQVSERYCLQEGRPLQL